MSVKLPPPLTKGDSIAVVATARVVDRRSVEDGIRILESWGLKVVAGTALFSSHNLFAGKDQERLQDLQLALDNPDIKAIICARGGYGTTRIIDMLNWTFFDKRPKWICGFSDVTALLCHVHSHKIACIHSSMPQLFGYEGSEMDWQSLRQTLFGQFNSLMAGPFTENQSGEAEGPLVGGNLSLLVHLIGTGSEISTDGKILFLEEVDEYLYHLDRMMVQLARSGKLKNLAGLAVGHLTKMKEGDLKFGTGAEGIIRSHVEHLKIPVGFGFPIGHQSPNLAIPLGVNGVLKVATAGSRIELKDQPGNEAAQYN